MILFLLGFGVLTGLSAAIGVGMATGSWLLALLTYSVGGTIFVLVAASVLAARMPETAAS